MTDAYAAAGVNTDEADRATNALVDVLRTIQLNRPRRSVIPSGHYASVLEIAPNLGLALSTDGVGSKAIVAERMRRFDTIGIDCIAMNVNDVVCVGAQPMAMVDYIAVEQISADMLRELAKGLKEGAELAEIEIPGGEVAQLKEIIRGHPSPYGFDLSGTCVGLVSLDQLITGDKISPGDVVIGIPSSGLHANGLTLARRAVEKAGLSLDDAPSFLAGRTIGEVLLQPTAIYVRALRDLLRSGVVVKGLAHITSNGLRNLFRLSEDVGYQIDAPLPAPPIFDFIQETMSVSPAEMHIVFNMGCGFCCIVGADAEAKALEILRAPYPQSNTIGQVTAQAGWLDLPTLGLRGSKAGFSSN